MQWNPYLAFDGKCETAFKFYAKCLYGQITAMIPYGDQPGCEEMPADQRGRIMHARLVAGNQILMGGDATSDRPFPGIKGFSVAVQVDTPAEADRLFNALSEKGNVTMPLAETFWALKFGMLTDQFGVPWMINCEKPQ